MFQPQTLSFRMSDGTERLDARAFRAILMSGLARHSEGVVVCDADHAILFTTSRGAQLLELAGSRGQNVLPEAVVTLLDTHRDSNDDTTSARLAATKGTSAIWVHVARLRDATPATTVIFLREEALRDDQLFATMSRAYGISRRSFQLAQLLRQGLSNRDIARELSLKESTVKIYLHELYRACGVTNRTALVALIERHGKGTA